MGRSRCCTVPVVTGIARCCCCAAPGATARGRRTYQTTAATRTMPIAAMIHRLIAISRSWSPQRPQELCTRRRQLEFGLDHLRAGLRRRDLGIPELDDAPGAVLVPRFRLREDVPRRDQRLLRRYERRFAGADRQPCLCDVDVHLLAERVELRDRVGDIGFAFAHLRAGQAALEEL